MTIEFTMNGESIALPAGSTLHDLRRDLDLGNTPVTIKINRLMVMRKNWHQEIQTGDRVEINLAVPVSCVTVSQD